MISMKEQLSPSLHAVKISKYFKQPHNKIVILDEADFEIFPNEVVAVVGPSGCGKTTFLQILGLLDKPDHGEIFINNINYSKGGDNKRTACRKNNIGFIYQAYNLLSNFTALENVMLPLLIQNISKKEVKKKAIDLLERLGLANRANHFPAQLSGGEQQRVAIARSVIHEPAIILADEPTGNLDKENSIKTITLLIDLVKSLQKSLVIVTHNPDISNKADKIVTIDNGKIINSTHYE